MADTQASAQWWCWWRDGGSDGRGGNQVCFARGTRIRTAECYRPIESLAVGDMVPARFAGLSAIEDIANFTLSRTGPNGS